MKQDLAFYELVKRPDFHFQMKLLTKIAKNSSEKEFLRFIECRELPAIKLTREELDLIAAGGIVYDFFYNVFSGVKKWRDDVKATSGSHGWIGSHGESL